MAETALDVISRCRVTSVSSSVAGFGGAWSSAMRVKAGYFSKVGGMNARARRTRDHAWGEARRSHRGSVPGGHGRQEQFEQHEYPP